MAQPPSNEPPSGMPGTGVQLQGVGARAEVAPVMPASDTSVQLQGVSAGAGAGPTTRVRDNWAARIASGATEPVNAAIEHGAPAATFAGEGRFTTNAEVISLRDTVLRQLEAILHEAAALRAIIPVDLDRRLGNQTVDKPDQSIEVVIRRIETAAKALENQVASNSPHGPTMQLGLDALDENLRRMLRWGTYLVAVVIAADEVVTRINHFCQQIAEMLPRVSSLMSSLGIW